MRSAFEEELAKMVLIERIPWEQFRLSTEPEIREFAKKALLKGRTASTAVCRP